MIDNFSLLLSHGLILLAFWHLLGRPDLDNERAGNGAGDKEEKNGAIEGS
jgi:hypothetical protein